MEKLDYLINYLLTERNETLEIDNLSYKDKKRIYCSLCNIRDAKPISEEYFKIENKYLQEELNKKDITDVADIQPAKELIKDLQTILQNLLKSIILQICILLHFMILKQKKKNGHIGQNIFIQIILEWDQQSYIKIF